MKPVIAAAAGLLFYFSASAQKINFKLGSEYELPKKATDLSFFGNSKDGIVNLALRDDKLYVVGFNAKTLDPNQEQSIEIEGASKNYSYEETIGMGGKVYFMHSDWDKHSETEILYYDEIDLKKGKVAQQNSKVLEASKMAGDWASGGFYSLKTVNKYQFAVNSDSSHLLVSYRLSPEFKNDKKNYDKVGLCVFNKSMKKVWSKEFTMPYTEAIMDNSDYTLDSAGNVYLLAKVYDSDARRERDKETGNPAYHYELMKFAAGSSKPTISVIPMEDNFINTAQIIDAQNQLLVAGTYAKKSNSNRTAGVFLTAIDGNGKVAKFRNGYYPFPKAELEKYESARTRRNIEKKDEPEVANLVVRNVLIGKDGGLMIACEESYYVVHTYTSSNGSIRTTYVYYNNDIIASRINGNGEFDWVRKIPKYQKGSVPVGTMSYKLISDEKGYYFLYLDNLKNLELGEGETPKQHVDGLGGQVMLTQIDNSGKMKKSIAFDTRDEDVMIYPRNFSKINSNQFIGRAQLKKGLYQPVLITLN
jgi:hypothetical protein